MLRNEAKYDNSNTYCSIFTDKIREGISAMEEQRQLGLVRQGLQLPLKIQLLSLLTTELEPVVV